MPDRADIAELVAKLQGVKKGTAFSPYIDFIVFPRYRGIGFGQRIDFGFPLTVLVGRNGTGKSSILHALSGAPYGENVARYWFGTAVDPVELPDIGEVEEDETAGGKKKLREDQKAAFWYGYRDGGTERQAIKQRVRRERAAGLEDREYWEPTRPNESYGMRPIPRSGNRRDRSPQIKMPVQYLSLRYHLSAFDRCFHFLSTAAIATYQRTMHWQKLGGTAEPSVQDYIRFRAFRLARAFERTAAMQGRRATLADAPQVLTPAELSLVSLIVGKTYESGTIVHHRLYDDIWADSVRFKTDGAAYTEANAGSGETAVLQIVRLFESAKPHSLLLLDEPETSLHPGAQRELLRYILGQIVRKKLQVVISTHAPDLVRDLPREAIKLLRRRDSQVTIEQDLSVEEAFYEIGHPFDPTCNVIVEDRLAKQLLDAVARGKGEAFAAQVRVEFRPGGVSEMNRDIATFMLGHHKPVFLFDGDQRRPQANPDQLSAGEVQDPDRLDAKITRQTGQTITFKENSRMAVLEPV